MIRAEPAAFAISTLGLTKDNVKQTLVALDSRKISELTERFFCFYPKF